MAAAVKVTTIGSSVGIDPSFAQKVDILEQVMRKTAMY